ncbi:MAG: hypothetical protein R3351_06750 [Nitrospirales bacterium]|nr:hypothetical protein [Nitrospirales bacterium]
MKFKTIIMMGCLFLMVVGGFPAAFGYEVAEVIDGATITGRIGFRGVPPEPLRFEVKKNSDVCGTERWLSKVEVHNDRLKGAVVMLQGVTKGKPFEASVHRGESPNDGAFHYAGGNALTLTVRTKSCNFGPYTGVLASQNLIRLENTDSVKHVLHSYAVRGRKASILRSVHNRDIFPGSDIEVEFTTKHLKHSNVVAITCDRHDFMENRFYVVDNPYFSLSDREGHFTIGQVPPGTYVLVVWHPVLGEKRQEITVEPNGTIEMNFDFAKK